jgi:hypothetical protein
MAMFDGVASDDEVVERVGALRPNLASRPANRRVATYGRIRTTRVSARTMRAGLERNAVGEVDTRAGYRRRVVVATATRKKYRLFLERRYSRARMEHFEPPANSPTRSGDVAFISTRIRIFQYLNARRAEDLATLSTRRATHLRH